MADWIVSSSALIVIVALLRFLLKGKISLRLQYALWALVLVRLLVPISFGQSSFSIENATKNAAETPVVMAFEQIGNAQIPKQSFRSAYSQAVQNYEAQGIDISTLGDSQLDCDALSLQYDGSLTVNEVLRSIWIIGAIVVFLTVFLSNLRFAVHLRRSRQRVECEETVLPIYVSKAVETPCLFGLFRPAIYVTPEVLNDEISLRHVLAHEANHYRHEDHIWALLRCVCLALH